jgi:predicted membrane protein
VFRRVRPFFLTQDPGAATIGQPIAYLAGRIGDRHMPLINLVFVLIVVGVGLWLINRFIPMASSIKSILNVVVVVAVCIWVLQAVGLWGSITSFRFSH